MNNYTPIGAKALMKLREHAAAHPDDWKARLIFQWGGCTGDNELYKLKHSHGERWLNQYQFPAPVGNPNISVERLIQALEPVIDGGFRPELNEDNVTELNFIWAELHAEMERETKQQEQQDAGF